MATNFIKPTIPKMVNQDVVDYLKSIGITVREVCVQDDGSISDLTVEENLTAAQINQIKTKYPNLVTINPQTVQ